MLAYNFSNKDDIVSQNILQTLIQKTQKFLQSRGYRIYEDGKNSWLARGRPYNNTVVRATI